MSRLSPFALPAILLLALALRVWGLTWGLPSALHYFSYHPDESLIFGYAMGMNAFQGKLLPHFYNYGSLHLYFINFVNTLAYLFGGGEIVIHDLSRQWDQFARMLLAGRLLSVGMGVGTVWAVCALGTRLWGRAAGRWAALLLALTPLHAQHSHWMTVDVPATLWGTLSLVWAARLAQGDAKPVRAAVCAGLFAGLGAATKYNMALAILPLIVASLLTRQLKPLAAGLAASALAFLCACPGFLLESNQFWRDLQFEAAHVRNATDPTFAGTGNGFVYHLITNLAAGMGWPLLLLALLGIGWGVRRRERGDGLLAAFALPYYVLIGLAAVRFARYVIPLLPLLALWAGRLLAQMPPIKLRAPVGLVVSAATLALCVLLIRPMAQTDPRDLAVGWLNAQAPSPTPLGFGALPWFGTPPVSPLFAGPRPGSWREMIPPSESARYLYGPAPLDPAVLSARPPVIVLSEYDYRDAARTGDPAFRAAWGTLNQTYRLAAEYGGGAVRPDGLRLHALPHDLLYPSPAILIFQRKP